MISEYDEISPITGDLCVLVETEEDGTCIKYCMQSGYYTKDTFLGGSLELDQHEKDLPDFIKNFKRQDESGNVWFLFSAGGTNSVLTPVPQNEDYYWALISQDGSEPEVFSKLDFGTAFDKWYNTNFKEESDEA